MINYKLLIFDYIYCSGLGLIVGSISAILSEATRHFVRINQLYIHIFVITTNLRYSHHLCVHLETGPTNINNG